jgi:hypothetical protein
LTNPLSAKLTGRHPLYYSIFPDGVCPRTQPDGASRLSLLCNYVSKNSPKLSAEDHSALMAETTTRPGARLGVRVPRYFFHVRDEKDIPDKEGAMFANDKEARAQAIATAGLILKDESAKFRGGYNEWSMTVLDEAGRKVCGLRFTIE